MHIIYYIHFSHRYLLKCCTWVQLTLLSLSNRFPSFAASESVCYIEASNAHKWGFKEFWGANGSLGIMIRPGGDNSHRMRLEGLFGNYRVLLAFECLWCLISLRCNK